MPATGVRAPDRMFVAVRAIAPVAGRPPTSGDSDVRDALRHQLHVRVVPIAAHLSATTADISDSIAPSIATVIAGTSSPGTSAG